MSVDVDPAGQYSTIESDAMSVVHSTLAVVRLIELVRTLVSVGGRAGAGTVVVVVTIAGAVVVVVTGTVVDVVVVTGTVVGVVVGGAAVVAYALKALRAGLGLKST
ncbi:MAG: hypothetical protein ABIV94_02670, partial [Acidimicrobiales bacterium]